MIRLPAPAFEEKIVAFESLSTSITLLARPIVFTNGVFDLLHRGHVTYLAQARTLGASLVVAINSDTSARMLDKGDGRPLNAQADRAAVVAALQCVTLVTVFEEKIPIAILEIVRPDVYVKGGDYDMAKIPESALVSSWGGKVHAIAFAHQQSTTKLLARMRGLPS